MTKLILKLWFGKYTPENFIREYKNKVYWYCISRCQTLSENFIREFKNTYSVLPFLKIENSENVKVSLEMNRYTINPRTLYNQILEHQKDHQ